MKRLLTAIAGVVALASPAWAQDVSRLNQDMDNRPNQQSEQTVDGRTSDPGVNVQQPEQKPASASRTIHRRRRIKASKTPPHFRGPAPTHIGGGGATASEPR